MCLRQCEYEDSIEFQGKEGSFHVCLRAVVPSHTLEVPESVMLPLCAVEHSTHTDFPLKNARYTVMSLCVFHLTCMCFLCWEEIENRTLAFILL